MLMQIGDTFEKPTSKSCRSSAPVVFLEKGFLKICRKFTGEHPCRSVNMQQIFRRTPIQESCFFASGSTLHLILREENVRWQDTRMKYPGYFIPNFRSASVVLMAIQKI